jgi:DMSO/TMAO reductase YedYZ molybdopterin-dependent catalytic subunit
MDPTRRKFLAAMALTATAGATGIALGARNGLIPPDHAGPFGPGAALTYAAHRLLGRSAHAREFPRDQISDKPFANHVAFKDEAYKKHEAAGFADWCLTIEGLVARPMSLSIAELKQSQPARSQITQLACEEGWSYIAEWTGAPLSSLLNTAGGVHPSAKYVVYHSMEKDWWDSVDLDEALHPQTLIAYGMNGADLPPAFGGPLRFRVPRQLGYKSVKFLNRLTVTDDLSKFGKGLGSPGPEYGYSWFAGI